MIDAESEAVKRRGDPGRGPFPRFALTGVGCDLSF